MRKMSRVTRDLKAEFNRNLSLKNKRNTNKIYKIQKKRNWGKIKIPFKKLLCKG